MSAANTTVEQDSNELRLWFPPLRSVCPLTSTLRRTMHRWVFLGLGSAALCACAPAADSADAQLKAGLVGSWHFDYKDEFERAVQGTVRLSEDGKFFGVEMVKAGEGLSESRLSGLWYVTDGLFKLNTQVADGKALGIQQQSFFTCKIAEFSPRGFSCRDEIATKTYTYTRASNAS